MILWVIPFLRAKVMKWPNLVKSRKIEISQGNGCYQFALNWSSSCLGTLDSLASWVELAEPLNSSPNDPISLLISYYMCCWFLQLSARSPSSPKALDNSPKAFLFGLCLHP
ncbi:hypothetical protein H5410_046157 [Solanum commersonii]|uniref:Uncharacterized protein n=1 Tax=Solanum commersonii TaxID=4109 RepID=A0A9J5XBH0_SOLCO|nr:hypothetical protein H5410_046157 [Solanum commersonii]